MKKISLILALIMLLSLSLTGCGSKTATSTNAGNKAAGTNQRNFVAPDLIGEISDIVGNQITLKLVKMPQMPKISNPNSSGTSSGNALVPGGGDMPVGDMPAGDFIPPEGFQRGNGGAGMQGQGDGQSGGQGGQRFRDFNASGASGAIPKMKLTYSGETKDIIVPIGVSIVTTSRSATGMTDTKKTFDELKKGDILQIYYAADKKTISKITLRSTSGGQTNANSN